MEHINRKTDASDNNVSESRFKTVLFLLRTAGIQLNVKTLSGVDIAYNTITVLCTYVTVLCLYMDSFVHRHNLVEFMEKVHLLAAMHVVIWIHLNLSYRKREVELLIRLTESFTWEELPIRDPDSGYLTKAGYIPLIQKLAKYVTVFAIAFHAIQSTARLVLYHDMMFTSWYPFDVAASPAYEISNVTQGIASVFMICSLTGFTSLCATLVCVACSQLEKLRAATLDIRQTHVTSEQDCGAETDQLEGQGQGQVRTSEELFSHMQKQLNGCIQHNQQIIRYMEALEDTFNVPLCGIFLIMLSTMCLAAFSAVTSWGDYAEVSRIMIIYTMAAGFVCAICWLGNELSNQAEEVREAVCGCEWVGTPVRFQRCILFMIANANKEFTLTAGKFVPVSNKTMMNMMNQTLSFFMFLLQMKDKGTDKNVEA